MDNFITFSSSSSFTVTISPKYWDGTIEYSLDKSTWSTYTDQIITANNSCGLYSVYFRGKNNTHMATSASNYSKFTFTGSNITGSGDLRDLLDYNEDELEDWDRNSLTVSNYAFYGLFKNCTNLVMGPDVRTIDVIPTYGCAEMYSGCTSLYKTPKFFAINIGDHGCYNMFKGCTNLWVVQGLPAQTLSANCYESMFEGCTGLVKPPKLISFNLATACYKNMFKGCVLLEDLPYLYATTLPESCYQSMFEGCSAIKLSASKTGDYRRPVRVPQLDTATVGTNALTDMFKSTTGTFTGTPTAGTTYYMNQISAVRFVSREPFTVNFWPSHVSNSVVQYSSNGSSWTTAPQNYYQTYVTAASEQSGDVYNVWLRSNSFVGVTRDYSSINVSGKDVHVIGTIEYLYDYEGSSSGNEYMIGNIFNGCQGIVTGPDLAGSNNAYRGTGTFKNCYNLIEAPEIYGNQSSRERFQEYFYNCTSLIVPPATLRKSSAPDVRDCYTSIFYLCDSLISPPKIQISGFYDYVLSNAFNSCRRLKTVPALPNTTLSSYCYQSMFRKCYSLKNISLELPATTLTNSCYNSMFADCRNLINAPDIKATSASGVTYSLENMFLNCHSLTQAPTIRLTTLGTNVCNSMFKNCTSLQTPPALPATTFAERCYNNMFYGCVGLTSPPTMTINSTATYCFASMFYGCTSLTDASSLVINTTTIESGACNGMFNYCTKLTTLPNISKVTTVKSYGMSSMFANCKSLVTPPSLSNITTVEASCFGSLFNGCISLTSAPDLPLTSVPNSGYSSMFAGCRSLTTAPSLPATTLGTSAYSSMFARCQKLKTAPALNATTLNNNCYQSMFLNCISLTNVPDLPATTLPNYCYSGMFNGCLSIQLSETQTGAYTIAVRVPKTGTATVGTSSLNNMFANTGGTWTGAPTAGTTYYMKPTYTITFNSNGGSSVTAETGRNNGYFNMPCPSKSGYIFDGWYTDSGFTSLFNYTTRLSANTTVNAKWVSPPTFDSIKDKALKFEAVSGGNFTMSINPLVSGYLFYSLDGTNWVNYNGGQVTTTSNKIYWIGRHNTLLARSYENTFFNFYNTPIRASGRLDMLFDYYCVLNNQSYNLEDYCASSLFAWCNELVKAPELPTLTIPNYGYSKLFDFCFNLETPPTEISATTIGNYSCENMFEDCVKIRTVPKLKVTSFLENAGYCFNYMFKEDTGLYEVPEDLFGSLTSVPNGFANSMFNYCQNLKNTPDLTKITTVGRYGYSSTFEYCYHLEDVSDLPATTIDTSSYQSMFGGCYWLKKAPKISATTCGESGCYGMFRYCYSLEKAPEIYFTTVGLRSCYDMFYGCYSLKMAPACLPAITLAESCYEEMFYQCSNLITCPEIKATTLAKNCCKRMFINCNQLRTITKLYATTLAEGCYQSMFESTGQWINTSSSSINNKAIRIPASGTGTTDTNALTDMFRYNNPSTVSDTPSINTTYYLAPKNSPIGFVRRNDMWLQYTRPYIKVSGTWKQGSPYEVTDHVVTNRVTY